MPSDEHPPADAQRTARRERIAAGAAVAGLVVAYLGYRHSKGSSSSSTSSGYTYPLTNPNASHPGATGVSSAAGTGGYYNPTGGMAATGPGTTTKPNAGYGGDPFGIVPRPIDLGGQPRDPSGGGDGIVPRPIDLYGPNPDRTLGAGGDGMTLRPISPGPAQTWTPGGSPSPFDPAQEPQLDALTTPTRR